MSEVGERNVQELSTNDLLLAILTLLVDEREQAVADRPGQVKTEILLANSGFSHRVIAQLLGKKPDAVRMMLSRARTSPNKAARRRRSGGTYAEDGQGA